MRRLVSRILNVFTRGTAEREMSREIAAHIALLQDSFEQQGLSPEQARLAAQRAYGGVEQAKELHRETRSVLWLENLLRDVRYGCRNLMQTPVFTGIAVLTLALGIGANTAIFSVVNSVLLRPLAYKDAGRLVTILHNGTGPVATANYLDWRDQSHSFEAMGAADFWSPNLASRDPHDSQPAEHMFGLKVTQNLFPMLGVQPMLGRFFLPGEDREGAEHEVILSAALWQRRFQSDRNVVGKLIALNGEAYTVVGVMPPGFQFAPFWATHTELWAPNAFGKGVYERGGNHLRVFARLKPGVTLAQARADMRTVSARLEKQYPATNRNVFVTPLKENVVGKIQAPLLMMLGSVSFVLLIACTNVAHMLLARTADKQKEIALRLALGVSKSRLIIQFLTEYLLLGIAGAAAGLVLATAGTKALVAVAPAYIPRVESIGTDAHVLIFLIAVTTITALGFGLLPATHAARANLSDVLKEGGRAGSDGVRRNRMRSILVASEFALAFILLIGAGLMIRSFFALQRVDPGFDPHNVLSTVVSVAGTQEEDGSRRPLFYRQLLDSVRKIPGVKAAGAINHLPLAGDLWDRSFEIEGRPKPRPGETPDAVYRIVMPGYFETMRLPIRRGRPISDRDDQNAPGVVLVNEEAARRHWPGESPVGKRIIIGANEGPHPNWLTVIGVVANAKLDDWTSNPYPEMYLAALQTPDFLGTGTDPVSAHMNYITLVVRGDGNSSDLVSPLRQTIWSYDRNLAISQVLTMDEAVAAATAESRFETLLLGLFGVVALALAAVGVYGVMNYSVVRRTREIGIRMSLGATRAHVLRTILRNAMLQAAAGTMVGIVGAVLLASLISKMLYGIQPTDPSTFIAVAIVIGLVSVIASGIPARRAIQIEPMVVLRGE